MVSIISVKNLKKIYKEKSVVDNISFNVEEGSLFSFLGPNGAGKSTTINIICTVLTPSDGEVLIDGLNVRTNSQDIRRKIGVVYQHNVLDDLLTVVENLRFRASLFGIVGENFENRLEEVANQLDFKNYLNQPFYTLSGGQKRRVEIARAIFHKPKILLLDEPTTGLDPESRKIVWGIIGKLKKEKPIKKLSSEEIQDSIDYHNEISKNELTLEQQSAVHNSLKNRISIITGGPGRGKTTVLSTIVEVWNDPNSIICLAPTGKAARRMSEAMSENGITMKTQTIHRFIMQLESSNSHCYDSLVIVDETSMVGIKLADRLLKRISDCQIILVGDVDQLASIEAGNVMKDIIKSKKVKTSYLTECFRNDGSILENANLINNGKTFKHFILDDATKFTHAESENIESEVLNSYRELRKKYDEKDIGILTPLRQRGFGSVNNINKIFRKEINPETIFNRECSLGFIVNDRVMNTKNRYDLKMRDNQTGKIINGIFNGDVGVVKYIDYDADEIDIEFEYEDKKFATGHWKFSDITGIFVPAWSITIHKSQGSEYKAVIMVISSSQCFFLKRNLIYTGLTRAKNFVNIIGDEKAINIGIRNIDDKIRNTYLAERIKKEAK